MQTFGLHLKSSSEKYQYRQISHSFDWLVLLTSVPSEMLILSKNNIYNIQTISWKKYVLDLSSFERLSKNIL